VALFTYRSLFSNKSHQAQALVEFAFVLPVLMLLTLGMIDMGRAFTFGVSAQQGAREAARYASRLAVSASSVSDATVLQRLIDSSSPALQGCQPITTAQNCGGAIWTFNVDATPAGSGTSYSSINGPSTPNAAANSTDPLLSGGQITVTAKGNVAMLGGFCMGQSLCLPPIGVQGQASMAFI
jgi:Flp pilus assembly protein TadG